MRIRLIALALATADAWLMFFIRQAATVDTSVWIALIAGVVGLLTLIIQSYTALQTARIKDKQAEQAVAVKDQGKQLTEQAVKIQEVHTVVNSGQSKMIEDMKVMLAELNELKGERTERAKSDAQAQNRLIGASEARTPAVAPATPSSAPLGATDAKPMHVEVVNPEPVKVVETKPGAPKE